MIHLLKSYYQQHHPFSADNTIALEQKLFSKLGTHTFTATVDRIAKRGETFIIYDYKTNKKLTPEIKASHKEQALLYAGIVLENYQKYFQNLEIRIEYLYLQKTTFRIVDQTEIQPVQQHYLALADEISSKKDAFKELNDSAIFPTNKGEQCKRCPFMNFCPAFSSLPSELKTSSLSRESILHLAQEYLREYQNVKSLEQEKQTLKEQLEHYFQNTDYQRIFGNDYQISYSLKDNRTIKDENTLHQLLAQKGLLEDSKTLDKNKVKKLFEAGAIPSNLIEERVVNSLSQKKM
jgi:RNase P subunit RPR2